MRWEFYCAQPPILAPACEHRLWFNTVILIGKQLPLLIFYSYNTPASTFLELWRIRLYSQGMPNFRFWLYMSGYKSINKNKCRKLWAEWSDLPFLAHSISKWGIKGRHAHAMWWMTIAAPSACGSWNRKKHLGQKKLWKFSRLMNPRYAARERVGKHRGHYAIQEEVRALSPTMNVTERET